MIGWYCSFFRNDSKDFSDDFSFCMKLGDYIGRKVTEPDFREKFLIWRYSQKVSKLAQNQTLIFFLKTAPTMIFVFGLKLVLNLTFNLNETNFSEKFSVWRDIFDLENLKKLPKLRFLAIFWTLYHQFSLIFHIMIGGHDV